MIASTLVLVGHQPAYLPWPGYLSRLLDVDRFLLLDHAQYSGGWQHRNYVAGPCGQRRLTVPVTHHFGQRIDQARIADDVWRGRHWRILQETYHRLTDSRALRVGAGALGYLDFAALTEAGIGVQVATYSHPPYPRGRQPSIPGLSALDLLLHQGPAGSRILSQGGQLTTWTEAISA